MQETHADGLIYLVHSLAWTSFILTRLLVSRGQPAAPEPPAPQSARRRTAPYSDLIDN